MARNLKKGDIWEEIESKTRYEIIEPMVSHANPMAWGHEIVIMKPLNNPSILEYCLHDEFFVERRFKKVLRELA